MFVRATRLRVPTDKVDAAIDNFTGVAVPAVKKLQGNTGAVLAVDRDQGRLIAITYWADEAALKASESATTGIRAGVADAAGGSVDEVDRFEVAIMDRAGQPHAGPYIRVVDLRGDPARVDDAVAFVRDRVIPTVRGLHGYLALICNVNRSSGRGVTTTVWETLEDLRASESASAPLRQEAASRAGASGATVEIYQSVYVDLALAAPTGS
jgi:heme-degrading monooxygenase HmoA